MLKRPLNLFILFLLLTVASCSGIVELGENRKDDDNLPSTNPYTDSSTDHSGFTGLDCVFPSFDESTYLNCESVPLDILAGKTCEKIDACRPLNGSNRYFLLTKDIYSPGTCIDFDAVESVFNLNGFTITYGDASFQGIANFDFESADGLDSTKAAQWTMPSSTAVKRVHDSRIYLSNDYLIKFENITSPQSIISDWVNITVPDVAYRGHAIIHGDAATVEIQSETTVTVCSSSGSGVVGCTFTPTADMLGKYRLKITVDSGTSYVDAANLRPSGYYGILYSYRAGKGNTVIKNGTIKDHGDGVYQGIGINNRSNPAEATDNYIISNVTVEAKGIDGKNVQINGPFNATITGSTLINKAPYVTNRHSLDGTLPFVFSHNTGHVVSYNKLIGGHGGVHFNYVEQAEIYCNEFHVRSSVTNHYAVSSWHSHNLNVHDNMFGTEDEPLKNGGVLFSEGTKNSNLRNNAFHLEGWHCDAEYPTDYQTIALRITDYCANGTDPAEPKTTSGNIIENNAVYGVATSYPDYPECTVSVTGVGISACGEGNKYFGNLFDLEATTIDSGSRALPINVASYTNTGYFEGNTFISNNCLVWLGGPYLGGGTSSGDGNFVSNTFSKKGDRSDFHTVIMGYLNDYDQLNHTFLDNTYTDGALLEDILLGSRGDTTYTIKWYLEVLVKDKDEKPISGATVEVHSDQESLDPLATNEQGKARFVLTQYAASRPAGSTLEKIPYTPHTVTVTNGDSTVSKEVTMDSSKTLEFLF